MAVVRGPLPDLGWTPVPNAWIRDPNLPQGPKALLIYYLSHEASYKCSNAQAAREQGVGRDTVTAQIKKLVSLGYLVEVVQTRGERGKWAENDYRITDCTRSAPPRPGVPDNPTGSTADLPPGTVPVLTGTVGPGTVNPAHRRPPGEDHPAPTEQAPDPKEERRRALDARASDLATEHYEASGRLANYLAVRSIIKRALDVSEDPGGFVKTGSRPRHTLDAVRQALARLREGGRPITLQTIGAELDRRGSTTRTATPYRDPTPDAYATEL